MLLARGGGFNFDNKKNAVNSKPKSPSQQKRDILRQKEFQKKDLEVANEAFENHL